MKRIILGTNTEAMILSHLTGYPMISHRQLGKGTFTTANFNIVNAMVLLNYTDSMIALCNSLNIKLEPRHLKIEYVNKGEVTDSIPKSWAWYLLQKKLTDFYSGKNIYTNEDNETILFAKTDNSNALYGHQDIDVLKTALTQVTGKNVVDLNGMGAIDYIKENTIVFKSGMEYEFDYAMTTVSAHTFHSLIHPSTTKENIKFESLPTTLMLYESNFPTHQKYKKSKKNVYYLDNNIPYSRINYFDNNNQLVIDITGHCEVPPEIDHYYHKTTVHLPIGKIKKINNLTYGKSIEPVGRFAQWNPDITLDNVIDRGMMQNDLYKLWYHQSLVHKKRMASNPHFATLKEKQEYTKEYILHMIDQSTDLLGEINWKMNIDQKEIYIDNIREQWVDIFKYWLSIGIVWGITPYEFLNLENFKQNKAIKRLEGKYLEY